MKKLILLLTAIIFFSWNGNSQSATEDGDFYTIDDIQDISITFPQSNWQNLLDSMRVYGDGLLIGNVKIGNEAFSNAGIRYRGGKSYKAGSKRNAVYIKLDYIHKNQHYQGHKVIKVTNSLRDPSLVREVLGYEIARKYMPAPRANYTKLSINGEYLGLFVNVEAVDSDFLEMHFGSSDNPFFKCSPEFSEDKPQRSECKKNIYASLEYESDPACYTQNFEIRSESGWEDLIELTRILNQEPDKIASVLNVDRTLWMLAFNNVVVNLSSYSGTNSQNYYLYKDDYGQFNPIIWDLNLAFGSLKSVGSGSDLDLKGLQRLDPLLHVNNATKPLISQLLKNPEYKKAYLSHLRTIVYDNFESEWYKTRVNTLHRIINDAYFNDPNKQYDYLDFVQSLESTIGKRSKIPGIVELMSKRSKYLKKHPEVSIFPPSVDEVMVMKREKFSNESVKDFKIVAKVAKRPKRVAVYYRYGKDSNFAKVYMADDGNHHDGAAGDNQYGVILIPPNGEDSIEYYIYAENAAAASFTPDNYMFEPYTSNLAELNN